jgi:hypothetical protein
MITMALLLICPHCQTKIALSWQTCPACGCNLRNLPRPDRRYFVYGPGSDAAAPPVPQAVNAPHGQGVEPDWLDSFPEAMGSQVSLQGNKEVSLCEALDRILHKGAVLFGEVLVSVADIDLVYLGLQVILASVETARGFKPGWREGHTGPNLSGKGV